MNATFIHWYLYFPFLIRFTHITCGEKDMISTVTEEMNSSITANSFKNTLKSFILPPGNTRHTEVQWVSSLHTSLHLPWHSHLVLNPARCKGLMSLSFTEFMSLLPLRLLEPNSTEVYFSFQRSNLKVLAMHIKVYYLHLSHWKCALWTQKIIIFFS
jgi:hypothetical protein